MNSGNYSSLAREICKGGASIDTYLNEIPRKDASLILKPVTLPEIERIVVHLPNKVSHGHDKISNILLKQLCPSISFPLCTIFNQSLTEGKFTSAMKQAEVIPLYKGKEFDKVVKYQPVSLLLTISKVLEKAVHVRVYKFLDKYKVLYDNHCGFCNNRSCKQVILEVVGDILQTRNNGEHSAALFLDLSKAFDSLDHTILLRKLDLYGL